MRNLVMLIFALSSILSASAGIAAPNSFSGLYQPYAFTCTYDASHDGMINVVSQINPAQNNLTVLIKSSLGSNVEKLQATNARVYSKTEKVDPETQMVISTFLRQLRIDQSRWFSTTDITVLLGGQWPMRFFKFNSVNGTLGIGVYVPDQGQRFFTECK